MSEHYDVESMVRDAGIVDDLAAMPCPTTTTTSGDEDCALCNAVDADTAPPEEHEPECPWRRAVLSRG